MKLIEVSMVTEQNNTTYLVKEIIVPIWTDGEYDEWQKDIENWTKNIRA